MAGLRAWRLPRSEQQVRLLVLVGLGVFVAGAYAVVVLGGGAVLGHTDSPYLGLSVVATVGVALALQPVRTLLHRQASRRVYRGRPSPYDVLGHLTSAVTATYPSAKLPQRLAMVLAQGVGAQWCEVWLATEEEEEALIATWPADDTEPTESADRPGVAGLHTVEVREGGELLGLLRAQERPDHPLTPGERQLLASVAEQAGPVLRDVRLRTALAARAAALTDRAEQVRASRRALVEAQADERRRLERDLQDGAQHLVALAVNLLLAQVLAQRAPGRASEVLNAQARAAQAAIEALGGLAWRIYPRVLPDRGLVGALEEAATASSLALRVTASGVERYPQGVEAAVYFSCWDVLAHAAGCYGARAGAIDLVVRDRLLTVSLQTDGRDLDPVSLADDAGLALVRLRLDAVGGSLRIETAAGGGVRAVASVPVALPVGAA